MAEENAHSSRFTRAEGSRGLKRILLQKDKLAVFFVVFIVVVLLVFDLKLSHFLSAILCSSASPSPSAPSTLVAAACVSRWLPLSLAFSRLESGNSTRTLSLLY